MTQFGNTFWDERYSTEEYIYGKEPNAFFKKYIEKLTPGKIFLPAEGEGRNGVYAASLGWIVDATDQSIAGKNKALNLSKELGVSLNYIVCDISEYDFPENHYDAAAIIYMHLPLDLRMSIHRKIVRSLKDNGVLIFEVYSKEQYGKTTGGPQEPDMLYTLDDIERDFKSLRTIVAESKTLFLNEGKKHSGESSVIRYVGTKD